MLNFENIHNEYRPKILRYLGNLVSEGAAPDLTQTVFVKVHKGLEDLEDKSALSCWIYRIATNVARDHADSSLARHNSAELLLEETDSLDDFADPKFRSTESEYIRREMNACIRGIVDQLPENYRTVLILSDFEELTNAEVADVLGLTLDTVKIRLHRGRAALREAMTCQCDLYHDDRNELMCDRKS